MKQPEECASLLEVRAEIDRLDHALMGLLGQRAGYVNRAAAFKTDQNAVKDPARVEAMLTARRDWACAAGIDPEFAAHLFQSITAYFIDRESRKWNEERSKAHVKNS